MAHSGFKVPILEGLLFFLVVGRVPVFAQTRDAKINDKKKSDVKVAVDYFSNNTLLGRSDSVTTPSFVPAITYDNRTGIYVTAAVNYIPSKPTQKIDGGSIEAGYNFSFRDNFTGKASFTKMFYPSSSRSLRSSLRSTLAGNFSYDISGLFTANADLNFNINQKGIKKDILFVPSLNRDFSITGIFGHEDSLIITPTVAINTGTQNYLTAYIARSVFRRPAIIDALTRERRYFTRFTLLDYEFSLPVNYQAGALTVSATPTYATIASKLPENLQKNFRPGNSVFLMDIGLTLTF